MAKVVSHTIEDTDDPELLGRTGVEDKVELFGLLAEYETVDDILKAARAVRRAGFLRWDVHSPFPIHGIDYAMGIKPTILPWIILVMGLVVGSLIMSLMLAITSINDIAI